MAGDATNLGIIYPMSGVAELPTELAVGKNSPHQACAEEFGTAATIAQNANVPLVTYSIYEAINTLPVNFSLAAAQVQGARLWVTLSRVIAPILRSGLVSIWLPQRLRAAGITLGASVGVAPLARRRQPTRR